LGAAFSAVLAALPVGAQTPAAPPSIGRPFGYDSTIEIGLPRGYAGYGSFPCTRGRGHCTARFTNWNALPSQAQIAEILSQAGRTEGVTETTCRVGRQGSLERCRSEGVTDKSILTAVSRAVALMRVPETMLGGLSTEGATVSISWKWGELDRGQYLNPMPTGGPR
jgi:hypothetical protein